MEQTVNNTEAKSEVESRPLLERLYERILFWRHEIRLETRPDLERLEEGFDLCKKCDLEEDFLVFVVGGCEWFFRVYKPDMAQLKKTIKDRLNTPNYSPYATPDGYSFLGERYVKTPRIPNIVNQYVNERIKNYWNDQARELSRMSLLPRVDFLAKEFDRPFQIREFRPLPAKRGGYPNLAPWIAGTVIYEFVRRKHPEKQDSRAIDASLVISSALLGRSVESSQFHKKRNEIESKNDNLGQRFKEAFLEFTKKNNEKIDMVLVDQRFAIPDYFVHLAWHFLDHCKFYES